MRVQRDYVGVFVLDAVHTDRSRKQPRDEVHQIHVVAAYVGERIRVFSGAPVLEVGVAVIPFLHQRG